MLCSNQLSYIAMMLIWMPLWLDGRATNGLKRERIFAVWGLFVNLGYQAPGTSHPEMPEPVDSQRRGSRAPQLPFRR